MPRIWFSFPRIFGDRAGISFALGELTKKPSHKRGGRSLRRDGLYLLPKPVAIGNVHGQQRLECGKHVPSLRRILPAELQFRDALT